VYALQGMRYLHQSCIQFHGHLSSNNVLVDGRWTCKITDYGLRYVRSLLQSENARPLIPGILYYCTAIYSLRTLLASILVIVHVYRRCQTPESLRALVRVECDETQPHPVQSVSHPLPSPVIAVAVNCWFQATSNLARPLALTDPVRQG